MTVSDGDILKVVVSWECPSAVIAQNVWYWTLDDPTPESPTNGQIISTLDSELSAMYNDIQSALSTEYEVEDFKTDRIEWNVDTWETVENLGLNDLSIVGGNALDAVPHGVAAVITGTTTRPQTRARKFFPGFGENLFEDSTLQGTIITALSALVVEWLSGRTVVGAASLEPVVLGQSGASAGLVYLILEASINAISGYQRRRKPGVGS